MTSDEGSHKNVLTKMFAFNLPSWYSLALCLQLLCMCMTCDLQLIERCQGFLLCCPEFIKFDP